MLGLGSDRRSAAAALPSARVAQALVVRECALSRAALGWLPPLSVSSAAAWTGIFLPEVARRLRIRNTLTHARAPPRSRNRPFRCTKRSHWEALLFTFVFSPLAQRLLAASRGANRALCVRCGPTDDTALVDACPQRSCGRSKRARRHVVVCTRTFMSYETHQDGSTDGTVCRH